MEPPVTPSPFAYWTGTGPDPRRLVQTPGGLLLDCDLACPGVTLGIPPALPPPAIPGVLPVSECPRMLRMEERIDLSWEDYGTIEGELLVLLGLEEPGILPRMVAGAVFLDLLSRFIEASGGRSDPEARTRVIDHFIGRMREERYDRPLRLADRSTVSRAVQRTVSTLFATAENLARKGRHSPGRLTWKWILRILLPGYRPLPAANLTEAEETLLSLYVRNAIWRKSLLIGHSDYFTGVVHRGYALLLCMVHRILLLRSRGESLENAVRTVEEDYVPASGTGKMVPQAVINENRYALQMFDGYSRKGFFARSMVGRQKGGP